MSKIQYSSLSRLCLISVTALFLTTSLLSPQDFCCVWKQNDPLKTGDCNLLPITEESASGDAFGVCVVDGANSVEVIVVARVLFIGFAHAQRGTNNAKTVTVWKCVSTGKKGPIPPLKVEVLGTVSVQTRISLSGMSEDDAGIFATPGKLNAFAIRHTPPEPDGVSHDEYGGKVSPPDGAFTFTVTQKAGDIADAQAGILTGSAFCRTTMSAITIAK